MRIGIVGAGVAGLVCAGSLRAQAHTLHHQSRRDDDRDAILNPTGCRPHPRRRRHSSGRRYRRPDRVSVQRPTPARRLDVKKQLVESQIMLRPLAEQYGGMDVSDAKRLKTRGAQNARLLATAMLETPDHAVVNAPP